MRAFPRRQKAQLLERRPIDQVNPIRHHVGDVKYLSIGGELDVLRHRFRLQFKCANNLPAGHVHLQQLAGEFAAGDQISSIRGEIQVIDSAVTGPSSKTASSWFADL
jgi:hypothetical protein